MCTATRQRLFNQKNSQIHLGKARAPEDLRVFLAPGCLGLLLLRIFHSVKPVNSSLTAGACPTYLWAVWALSMMPEHAGLLPVSEWCLLLLIVAPIRSCRQQAEWYVFRANVRYAIPNFRGCSPTHEYVRVRYVGLAYSRRHTRDLLLYNILAREGHEGVPSGFTAPVHAGRGKCVPIVPSMIWGRR